MKPAGLLLVAFVMIGGCARPVSSSSWRHAVTHAQTGNIIAFWLQYRDKEQAISLEYEYGTIIIWNEKKKHFYLFDNPQKRYFGTDDFDVFITEIDALPQNITLHQIDTCTVPLDWKMPNEASGKLAAVLRKGNRTPARSVMACTCGSTGRRFIDDVSVPVPE